MKDMGIPGADYVTFGTFSGQDGRMDIPHHNFTTMNGFNRISNDSYPKQMKGLAENVIDDIRDILQIHIHPSAAEETEIAEFENQ